MLFGVDYYPEHWGEPKWEQDIRMMKKLNFNIIRIAEFAWCRLEPEEGRYDFTWVDRVLELCEKYDMKVMMGLPVRNVPAWLMEKDPSMAIKAFDGHREAFGSRYTTCLNNPTLREHALKLSRIMALRYKDSAIVNSWHLDNEYGDASICYCENCKQEFIKWLQNKYGSVENLNKTWGLVFWSLEINKWEQVWVPSRGNHFAHNPSLLQDYRRFTSWTTEEFVRIHAQIFKELTPDKIITTNYQSMSRYHTDYHKLGTYLDVVSTNYYPPVSYNSIDLDIFRGIKNQNFWVVEQKAGTPGFEHNGFLNPAPGETRMYTYQSIAHGADAILYFRWRPSYFGQEQMHRGILNYDSTTNRISDEIGKVGKELDKVWEAVEGTSVKSEAAILMSYDTRWALEYYKPHPDMEYKKFVLQYHGELERQHISVDMVNPKIDLSGYKIVIVPLLYMMDEETVRNIVSYVENGGTVIFTARSGAKDENSNLVTTILPAEISRMLGIQIDEAMAVAHEYTNNIEMDGKEYSVSRWIDLVKPLTAEVLARYTGDWFKNYAAITVNNFGKGKAYYIGTLPEDSFYSQEIAEIVKDAGAKPVLEAPRDVQVCRRENDNKEIVFLLNNSAENNIINLPQKFYDVLEQKVVEGSIRLEPYGVSILKTETRA